MNVDIVQHEDRVLAILTRMQQGEFGTGFATPPGFPLQVGFVSRAMGQTIQVHRHRPVVRQSYDGPRQEVFVVLSGLVKVRLFVDEAEVACLLLGHGDVLHLLGECWHSVEFVSTAQFVEIATGPYADDKETR